LPQSNLGSRRERVLQYAAPRRVVVGAQMRRPVVFVPRQTYYHSHPSIRTETKTSMNPRGL
jgi:hypothetical protein